MRLTGIKSKCPVVNFNWKKKEKKNVKGVCVHTRAILISQDVLCIYLLAGIEA
jgi:hypothetical protein